MNTHIPVSLNSIKLLRIMLSGIFIIAGASHLLKPDKTAQRIEMASFSQFAHFFGNPTTLVILSGIVMLIAGISFAIGFKTKWSALILLLVLIPITITVQIGQLTTMGPLFKNIAIFGGLSFFILNQTQKK
ncbi:DoxX family protein [Xanthomarina sp. F1114]|uniref:DoxX family protein n=1 Tax=Xanthomarina sp. F1114 TaxID=2996019 RepID=UPI00225E6EC0|nr:DoxX family protein [Xanthomarina sp. F1114]MCX7548301.1 DoxX family protein [Xanthomarina sp. F1114]